MSLTQPIRFSHSVHARQDIPCATCHFAGRGGAFSGLPPIATCAGCHTEPTGGRGEDQKEADKLVFQYVKSGQDVPWLVAAREPGHVLFVHGPHLGQGGGRDCASCHPDMSREDYPDLKRDRISGYFNWTMPMARCRACHVASKASDDCVACHS